MFFMQKGFDVFRALSPSSDCDLLIMDRKTRITKFIEVRTGYRSKNTGRLTYPVNNIENKTVVVVVYGPSGHEVVEIKPNDPKARKKQNTG